MTSAGHKCQEMGRIGKGLQEAYVASIFLFKIMFSLSKDLMKVPFMVYFIPQKKGWVEINVKNEWRRV